MRDKLLYIKIDCEAVMLMYQYNPPTFERLQNIRSEIEQLVRDRWTGNDIEQWHVTCNRDNNTEEEIAAGRVRAQIHIWEDKEKMDESFTVSMPFQFQGWFNNA